DSKLFASDDMSDPHVEAILDYHRIGADSAPRFCYNRVRYDFPLSEEWAAWHENSGKAMEMVEFAQFLEDHIVNVRAETGELSGETASFVASIGGRFATPSKLIEISRGLQVNENSVLKEVRNLSNGEAQMVFTAEHTGADGQPLVLPNFFMIGIPVFRRS